MTTADVGDVATLTLTVSPADVDTAATLTVVSPTGVTTTPSTTPNADRTQWTALVPLLEAGEYIGRWTVAGTGAGVEQQTLTARPTLPVTIAGQRVYATTADLAHSLEAAPPTGARRKLRHASQIVERRTKCAIYDVDVNGFPTKTEVKNAFRDAVCAQVEWWGETGDEFGTAGQWDNVKIGSVALGGRKSTSHAGGEELAPAAESILDNAGLLPGTVSHYRTWESAWP